MDQHNGFISAVSAVFIAIFTVVLAWKTAGLYEATRGLQAFANIQSEEMKTSIEQARRAATAMEVAAHSSEGSLEVAKSSLRDTERAFVHLKLFFGGPASSHSANAASSACASRSSGISGIGAKPLSAGARTAWASARRSVNWRSVN